MLQKKSIGSLESDLSISETEIKSIEEVSEKIEVETLILFWQIILKGLEELYIVSNPILSLEMLIIKLLHLKAMPSYENILNKEDKLSEIKEIKTKILKDQNQINKISKEQIKSTIQTKPELTSLKSEEKNINYVKSFEDLIKLSSEKKEIELKYDLEKNVNLIKFSEGKIDIAFNENLSKDFVRNLTLKLLEWTKKRWVITLTKGKGEKTISEKKEINKKKILEGEKENDLYKKFKNTFPDADLIDVSKKD
tara:strand:- start:159 stop:914 length:756 start_codon:yes stop_codon:yes gene_type:complete